MKKSSLSRFPSLNDDEIKRIMSVIERDFKLRQKEYQRIEKVKDVLREENQRVEYFARRKESDYPRCLKCGKLFRKFFKPKEKCAVCHLYVCHDCSILDNQKNTWTCKTCLTVKELEYSTGDWFYQEVGKKYKRCGSAKVIRELHKRQKELANIDELDEDFGYGTLLTNYSTDSKDSNSVASYVVHDKNVDRQLNEYSKQLSLLVRSLRLDSIRIKNKENLRSYQEQIISTISRARAALIESLREYNNLGSNQKIQQTYENDLQYLLIRKTEESLQLNLQQFEKNFTTENPITFDRALAQIIFEQCINQSLSNSNSSRNNNSLPTTQRQLSASSSFELTRTTNPSLEMKPPTDAFQRRNILQTSAIDDDDDGDENTKERTSSRSSTDDDDDENFDPRNNNNNQFVNTVRETIRKSNGHADNWKRNISTTTPSDDNKQIENLTWL